VALKPIKLPPFEVPSGVAAGDQELEGFPSGPYNPKTWTGRPPRASDAATMPVIGAENIVLYHGMNFGTFLPGTLAPLHPSSPGFATSDPHWGVQNKLLRLPRELILITGAGAATDTVFAPFVAAHLDDLIAGRVYINEAASLCNVNYGSGGDIAHFPFGGPLPSLVFYLPATGL
jgi:hypothetical protein